MLFNEYFSITRWCKGVNSFLCSFLFYCFLVQKAYLELQGIWVEDSLCKRCYQEIQNDIKNSANDINDDLQANHHENSASKNKDAGNYKWILLS